MRKLEEEGRRMLKLADLRKTTRRTGDGDLRAVYPRFLRDTALSPRIELAIRYFERMLDAPRAALDAEVIVQLFGDHKLARCIVACLAASYRPRQRTFAEVLSEPRAAALAERGLVDPSALRLWLFRRANTVLPGFVAAEERPGFLRAVGHELDLAPDEIDMLLALDAPAYAVLTRSGPVPTPADVIARFNFETAAALLASASLVRLRLRLQRAAPDAVAVRALCAAAAVRAELGPRELLLHGRQDALGSWGRHGSRLAALVADLLACGLPARAGEAIVAAPAGGEWRFRLDGEILGYLGAPDARAPACSPLRLLAARERATALATATTSLRRTSSAGGTWRLRRAAMPLVLARGIWPTLFACTRERASVALVAPPTSAESARQLASLAARVPLVALADHSGTADELAGWERTGGIHVLRFDCREDAARLPVVLAAAATQVEARIATAHFETLLDEARSSGVLVEGRLAERLKCEDDYLAARLAEPAARAALVARGLCYVEGFGLCTAEVLARAQAASADVAHLRGDPAVGSAWLLRVLGRKLREVTGASEGIECLIAYLGAA